MSAIPNAARDWNDAEPFTPPPATDDSASQSDPATNAAASLLKALDTATLTAEQFREAKFPVRRRLLGEWLCEADYGMIFAPRGAGKTWLAFHFAITLTEGGTMGEWSAQEPVGVLYLDAEMPPDLLREREKGLSRRSSDGRLHILNHAVLFEHTEQPVNIAEPEWQETLTELLVRRGAKVLIVDNRPPAKVGRSANGALPYQPGATPQESGVHSVQG